MVGGGSRVGEGIRERKDNGGTGGRETQARQFIAEIRSLCWFASVSRLSFVALNLIKLVEQDFFFFCFTEPGCQPSCECVLFSVAFLHPQNLLITHPVYGGRQR